VAVLLSACGAGWPAAGQDVALPTIRQDVRYGEPASPYGAPAAPGPSGPLGPAGSPAPPASPAPHQNPNSSYGSGFSTTGDPEMDMALGTVAVFAAGAAAITPFVGPMKLLDDKITKNGHFFPYPYYDPGGDGYIVQNARPGLTQPWSVRLDVEYMETFDRLDNMGGHLLLDTASRVGLEASLEHLEERLSGGGRDEMSVGDWNLVWRFAQGTWGEFHTGLGMNWLNDGGGANLGFNFTYGADLFPVKPWIISSSLDWGTLGRTELFRFRSTAGLEFHGVETYVGYEYTDIGRGHWNGLIGGLRFWF
jgi:hypothetical protein